MSTKLGESSRGLGIQLQSCSSRSSEDEGYRAPYLDPKSDGGTIIPEQMSEEEEEEEEVSDEEEEVELVEGRINEVMTRGRRRERNKEWIWGYVWVGLSATVIVNGRRVLRGGFPFPIYFVFLTQLGAYVVAAVTTLCGRLMNVRRKSKSNDDNEELSDLGFFVIGLRTIFASCSEGLAMICAAHAVLEFSSLPLLAMLPIITFAFDNIFFRLASLIRLIPRDQSTSWWRIYQLFIVFGCTGLVLHEDYRFNKRAVFLAISSFFLFSLSKLLSQIGPRFEKKGAPPWEKPLKNYLWSSLPQLVIAARLTTKLENYPAALEIARSWSFTTQLTNVGPAVLFLILFRSSLNTAFPFTPTQHVGGALEETSPAAVDAISSTLQSGLWVIVIGVFGNEYNFINWFQAAAFTLMYIVIVGPRHIAYYPPKAMNLISRLLRRRQMPIHQEPWQKPFFVIITTIIFAPLLTCIMIYWVDTVAFSHSLKAWIEPTQIYVDIPYRPPKSRDVEVIIAHSPGDDLESIIRLVHSFAQNEKIWWMNARAIIYTKDKALNLTTTVLDEIKDKAGYPREVIAKPLPNIGGVTASFLHHILESWDKLSVETIFLSTSSLPEHLLLPIRSRFEKYFVEPGSPLPDALPKTGFLNLGDQEVCTDCRSCTDSMGWEDSFHLVPSLYGASHPDNTCSSVILTYGNNFIASAARIRGVKKDVWEILHDALTNKDLRNAWAHEEVKMPLMSVWEEGKGRWKEGSVYGVKDSLEAPWLGFTIERLWGVLLQCSGGWQAWSCPSLEKGWRRWGEQKDCGCID